nr:MAG TPA: hypothetical protein [Caudoviricetes sp.]
MKCVCTANLHQNVHFRVSDIILKNKTKRQ